ncbi:putative uncharacterized protein [Bacteroides sp. CAG:702]|nr:putative uncharacterized protein [Bacteroides sp. CAG:702]
MNKGEMKRLGDYIREVDVRNRNLEVTKLVGLTIDKSFIPSVANVIGTDLSKYKIIRKEQFACSLMQVSRDGKVPIAMLEEREAIMSPAYPVFEVFDTTKLLPQYLMMWFSRKEFDREASFYAVGGVRGSLTWEDFCDMTLPIPPIEQQQKIVSEYEAITRRIRLNEQIITKLEETAQTLYRKMFVDGVDKENLPEGWRMGTLGEVADYVSEKRNISSFSERTYISTENMLKNKKGIIFALSLPSTGKGTVFQKEDILVSNIRPYFKKIWKATFEGCCSNDVLCLRVRKNFDSHLLYYAIERDVFFDYVMAGSNGVKMPRGDKEWIMKYPLVIPNEQSLDYFNQKAHAIDILKMCKRQENNQLIELQSLLLAKMGQ